MMGIIPMNKKCLILSHVWILDSQSYKKDVLDFTVNYFRKHNPDLYIILTGHGEPPHNETLSMCDYIHWTDFDETEIGKGHPKLVRHALEHAKEKGFDKVLKQRGDCINAEPNIHDAFDSLMGDKKMLLTSEHGVLGDLCMYGDLDLFLEGWNLEKWDTSLDGMDNFNNTFSNHDKIKWTSINEMKWVYLDPYWEEINTRETLSNFLDNNFNYENYMWWSRVSHRAQSWPFHE
tara:strand:+ start:756 stop:1454 length:699 start_codon:yes stop_codon:yes gene_type:complete